MGKPVLRDKLGRVLPGSGKLPGGGRPTKKRDVLDKLMKRFYGPDCEALLLDVVAIAQYDQLALKHRIPQFTSVQVADARKFLFEHFYGRPLQESKTEISTPEDQTININFIKSKNDN